jgi:hypothetical protein
VLPEEPLQAFAADHTTPVPDRAAYATGTVIARSDRGPSPGVRALQADGVPLDVAAAAAPLEPPARPFLAPP